MEAKVRREEEQQQGQGWRKGAKNTKGTMEGGRAGGKPERKDKVKLKRKS